MGCRDKLSTRSIIFACTIDSIKQSRILSAISNFYSTGVAATLRSSRSNGRTEKNLCRQGSHRNAGIRSTRQKIDVVPGTYSAEIRCNARLPQIPQCA